MLKNYDIELYNKLKLGNLNFDNINCLRHLLN